MNEILQWSVIIALGGFQFWQWTRYFYVPSCEPGVELDEEPTTFGLVGTDEDDYKPITKVSDTGMW